MHAHGHASAGLGNVTNYNDLSCTCTFTVPCRPGSRKIQLPHELRNGKGSAQLSFAHRRQAAAHRASLHCSRGRGRGRGRSQHAARELPTCSYSNRDIFGSAVSDGRRPFCSLENVTICICAWGPQKCFAFRLAVSCLRRRAGRDCWVAGPREVHPAQARCSGHGPLRCMSHRNSNRRSPSQIHCQS